MRVIIAYDGSDGSQAAVEDLKRAGLGENVDATIVSVAEVWGPAPETALGLEQPFPIYTPPEVRSAHEIAAQAMEKMRSVTDDMTARLQSVFPSWKLSTEVLSGSPWWEVINKTNELQANLIVVGSHGRSALGRFFLGSVSQKIINEAGCSVRVGRKRAEGSVSARLLLIGVDGSSGSETAVHEVARREWPSGMQVHVISAEDPNVPLAFGGLNEDIAQWVQKIVDTSAEYLRQAGLTVSAEVKQGDPKRVLVDEAERLDADCIFVGASGLSNRLERFLLGSVSTAVANRAECSVEVVRPAKKS